MLASSYENIINILDSNCNFDKIKSFELCRNRIMKMIYSPNNEILAILYEDKICIIKNNVLKL